MPSEETKLAVLIEKVTEITKDTINFVTRMEFNSRMNPIEKIVYGLTGMILIAFITAVIALVIQK